VGSWGDEVGNAWALAFESSGTTLMLCIYREQRPSSRICAVGWPPVQRGERSFLVFSLSGTHRLRLVSQGMASTANGGVVGSAARTSSKRSSKHAIK
jgi:hypothetical protein